MTMSESNTDSEESGGVYSDYDFGGMDSIDSPIGRPLEHVRANLYEAPISGRRYQMDDNGTLYRVDD